MTWFVVADGRARLCRRFDAGKARVEPAGGELALDSSSELPDTNA